MIHTDLDPKDIIGYGPGDTVIYVGADDIQVNWGYGDDPRKFLKEGEEYTVTGAEIHDTYTKVFIEGFEGKKFPSVAFRPVEVKDETDPDTFCN